MNIRFLSTTAALVLLSACAAAPAPPAPATVVAAVPAVSATPAATTNGGQDEHTKYLAKKARELDYQVETRNGQRNYCLNSAPLGSRFEKKSCVNEAQFEDVVRNSAEIQNYMRQGNCSGPGCVHN